MTSVSAGPKQSNGHFMILSSLCGVADTSAAAAGQFYAYSGSSGSGASATVGNFTVSASATGNGATAPHAVALGAYSLLKDMGQTIVSANRLFRKVAPLLSGQSANPFGTSGTGIAFGVSTVSATDSTPLIGYVELGYEGFGKAAPIARFNTL